jgi:hypothetical protein
MQFQGAVDQIPKEVPSFDVQGQMRHSILFKSTIDETLDLLNIAAQTPHCYFGSKLSAAPIASIIIDLINTDLGKAIVSRPDVNQHLRNIMNYYRVMLTTQ